MNRCRSERSDTAIGVPDRDTARGDWKLVNERERTLIDLTLERDRSQSLEVFSGIGEDDLEAVTLQLSEKLDCLVHPRSESTGVEK